MNKDKILEQVEKAIKAFSEIHILATEKQFEKNQRELLSEQRNKGQKQLIH